MMKKVTAAIITRDDRVLIARRKAGAQAGKWEFPGGKIEEGETPEQCLQRELREELQIEATIGSFFGESEYEYENGAIRLMAYLARWDKGEMQPTVHTEFRWVPPRELEKYDLAPADIPLAQKLAGLPTNNEIR